MATILFVVKATIRKDREEAFNRWYNEEHVPQVLQWKGVVSARRYRAILGEDTYQYMAVYELVNEANFRALMESDHMKALRAEYDAHFGDSAVPSPRLSVGAAQPAHGARDVVG